jgi:hypothetical protein
MTNKTKLKKIKELSHIYSELNNYFFAVCQGYLLISDYVVLVSNLAPKIDELQNELGIIKK